MKRPLVAAALAGAIGLLPGAGHASSVNAITCGVTGTATYEEAVTAVSDPNGFTFTGSITCYEASTDGSVVTTDTFAGDLSGTGSGFVGCGAGTSTGGIEAIFPTGENTRDLWTGNFGAVGGALSAATVTLNSIEHQTYDETLGEWVTDSAEGVGPGGAAGTLQFSVSDPTVCAGDGFTEAVFDGRISGAFAASA